jgi:hypothetical protein
MDLSTKEGALDLLDDHNHLVADLFLQQGKLHAFGLVLARVNPETGRAFPEVVPLIVHCPPEGGTEVLAKILRESVRRTYGVGALWSAEVWMAIPTQSTQGMTPEQVRATLPRDLEQASGRRELLITVLEHVTGIEIRLCEIERNADGEPKLGAWEKVQADALAGRMTSLVQKD